MFGRYLGQGPARSPTSRRAPQGDHGSACFTEGHAEAQKRWSPFRAGWGVPRPGLPLILVCERGLDGPDSPGPSELGRQTTFLEKAILGTRTLTPHLPEPHTGRVLLRRPQWTEQRGRVRPSEQLQSERHSAGRGESAKGERLSHNARVLPLPILQVTSQGVGLPVWGGHPEVTDSCPFGRVGDPKPWQEGGPAAHRGRVPRPSPAHPHSTRVYQTNLAGARQSQGWAWAPRGGPARRP